MGDLTTTAGELLPDFSRELQDLTRAAGRPDLAEQVPSLPVVARCPCGEANCAHFYTAAPPAHTPPVTTALSCPPFVAWSCRMSFDERVVGVDVLDRPDVKVIDRQVLAANLIAP